MAYAKELGNKGLSQRPFHLTALTGLIAAAPASAIQLRESADVATAINSKIESGPCISQTAARERRRTSLVRHSRMYSPASAKQLRERADHNIREIRAKSHRPASAIQLRARADSALFLSSAICARSCISKTAARESADTRWRS